MIYLTNFLTDGSVEVTKRIIKIQAVSTLSRQKVVSKLIARPPNLYWSIRKLCSPCLIPQCLKWTEGTLLIYSVATGMLISLHLRTWSSNIMGHSLQSKAFTWTLMTSLKILKLNLQRTKITISRQISKRCLTESQSLKITKSGRNTVLISTIQRKKEFCRTKNLTSNASSN